MAASLSSAIFFHPLDKHFHGAKNDKVPTKIKTENIISPSGFVGFRKSTLKKKKQFHLLVVNEDSITTKTSQKSPENGENAQKSVLDNPNGSFISSDNIKPEIKRTPLTAREKLRAARVLGRYTESKPSKAQLGSKVLEALRESDKRDKKRSGLPEAPTNLFDDSKRGMPKAGLTWELPVGFDVALIVVSFVLISTLMFATTYFVWKVGAIHFNEN